MLKILMCMCRVRVSWQASFLAVMLAVFLSTAAHAVNAPTITPGTGVYTSAQPTATITGDAGASFYYSLDGTNPTHTTGTLYTGAFPIANPATIKAIAYIAPNESPVTSSYVQFDPNSLPISRTGLQLWLKSDVGVVTTGSSKVTNWIDMSGAGHDAVQTVNANRPTLVANAFNGWSSVKFNGTSQNLVLPSNFSTFSGCSFFIVANPAAVTAGARMIDLGNGATSDNLQIQEPTSTGASFFIYNGSTPSSVTSSNALVLNQYHLLEAVASGTTATIFTDGAQGAQNTSMQTINNLTRANNFLGQGSAGGNFFNGQISEVFVYSTAISDSLRSALESYALQKYQVSMQVPTKPIVSIGTSTLTKPTQVALAAQPNAEIRFTQDGSTPGLTSPLYQRPIDILWSQTLKSIAVVNGVKSTVTTATYTVSPAVQWPPPDSTSAPLQINEQLPNISVP